MPTLRQKVAMLKPDHQRKVEEYVDKLAEFEQTIAHVIDVSEQLETIRNETTCRCSFCGKYAKEVKRMIASEKTYICSECVELCVEILQEADREDAEQK